MRIRASWTTPTASKQISTRRSRTTGWQRFKWWVWQQTVSTTLWWTLYRWDTRWCCLKMPPREFRQMEPSRCHKLQDMLKDMGRVAVIIGAADNYNTSCPQCPDLVRLRRCRACFKHLVISLECRMSLISYSEFLREDRKTHTRAVKPMS